jgi:hypothetical protein
MTLNNALANVSMAGRMHSFQSWKQKWKENVSVLDTTDFYRFFSILYSAESKFREELPMRRKIQF